jgi:ATP-binding cassette subfamily C protein
MGGLLPIVLILVQAPWLTRHGASTGAILGALTYVLNGVEPALQTFMRRVANMGLWLIVTLRRVVEVTEPSRARRAHTSHRHLPDDDGVELVDVTFAYGPQADPVIRGFNLTISPGDHLAIVGPSGAGKSTLANIISGMLTPQRGSVLYGRTAVTGLDDPTRAACRVLIPQEAYLFAGTVRENLLYLHDGASQSELDRAVEEIGARPLLMRLGGYEAELTSSELSAGERQLLTLVRAYLSPARLVILDEAACHLDPAAETRAETAFVKRGGTLVVIAHRMSSALRARHVLVLDGAETILGTHQQLLAASPLYRNLVGYWQPQWADPEPRSPLSIS